MGQNDNFWGRRYSYGGLGPLSVPRLSNNSGVIKTQKGHLHFGSGADVIPRNIACSQQYNVTLLKKSINRAHDELQPPPGSSDPNLWKMKSRFVKENPYSSHQSRFDVFPTWKESYIKSRSDKSDVVHKTAGNIGRFELNNFSLVTEQNKCDENEITEAKSEANEIEVDKKAKEASENINTLPRLSELTDFFSRHKVISSFNQRYPSQTPALTGRPGRRPADWHLSVATHTVGR